MIQVYTDPGGDISFPIFIRRETKTRKWEWKSNQQISRLNDLLHSFFFFWDVIILLCNSPVTLLVHHRKYPIPYR